MSKPTINPHTSQQSFSEQQTRTQLIDTQLLAAGWDVADKTRVGSEIPVDGTDPAIWAKLEKTLRDLGDAPGYVVNLPSGISDYALYRENGEIIAVVEAKKASRDVRIARAQVEFYVSEIEKRQSFRPYAFLANGRDIYFWDVGLSEPRLVYGFFSPEVLSNLLSLRQNKHSLRDVPLNLSIVNRSYQLEAVRRVCEAFERDKRRKALLVMATGTGKTRTAMALCDVFMRANQARNILFVADRDELVQQAQDDGFKVHLPDEPCARIFTGTAAASQTARLFVATLQTLSNCFREFNVGFFDLIIFDEVHRSIFNKWNDVLDYFDARMIGLTATPAGAIDRNTFVEFDCHDGVPTFVFEYARAVAEKHLVDFSLYKAQTGFQRDGIHGATLTEEERNLLIAQGHDPDTIDYSGTELERNVSNTDTLRKQWEEIWEHCIKDQSGSLPGKTIVFAMTQDHALRLKETFDEMYPQHPGLCAVITYETNWKRKPLQAYKKENLPRIAITVDLMETGVDVPEVVNLVFMRPVQSPIKLAQMIGRGTRNNETCKHRDWLPDGKKSGFLIMDFWQNDFDRNADKQPPQSLPVLVSLFNTRLKLLEMTLRGGQPDVQAQVITDLQAMIARIPTEAFSVRRALPDVEAAKQDGFWLYLSDDKLTFLRNKISPLLRFASEVDVAAETFTHKLERLKLALLMHRDTAALVQEIAEDVSYLPDDVLNDAARQGDVALAASGDLRNATPAQIDDVRHHLAGEMRRKRERPNSFITLNLPDAIALSGYIWLKNGTERVFVEDYRMRVEAGVMALIDGDPVIDAISRGNEVTDEALLRLERKLRETLSGGETELVEDNIRRAYRIKVGSLIEFLRHLLALPNLPDYADIVRNQFSMYIVGHRFTADQTRFLRAVENVFIQKRHLKLPDLYEQPFTHFGVDAVDRLFTAAQVDDVLRFAETLAV